MFAVIAIGCAEFIEDVFFLVKRDFFIKQEDASLLTKSDPFVLVWNDPRDAQLISWQI